MLAHTLASIPSAHLARPTVAHSPIVLVHMLRLSTTRRSTALLLGGALLLAVSCADNKQPSGATAKGGGSAGDVAVDSAGARAKDSGARGAAAPAAPQVAQGQREADLPPGDLPKRPRKDSVALESMTRTDSALDKLWPVNGPVAAPGALLPSKRIVAYYGNPLSKKMGVLGEYPKDEMLAMLDKETARWAKADPSHPVVPALHLIVTVAQGAPGKNGLYRTQHRDSMVNEIYSWIKPKRGVLFLDIQVGKSTVEAEVPRLRAFLENPDVHLALDPEFSMAPSGAVPGTKIGTLDAKNINWAIQFLDEIARTKNLPPKILVIHRFTRKMVTNAKDIRPTPHVQVVMDMDGWGPPWLKFDSYRDYVKREPVQYTGFKIFYHNDTKKGDHLLTPSEVLRLNPRPLYIQYQ